MFEKGNDLTVSKQTAVAGVIKIHSTRTRDPLRQRKRFSSSPKRDETISKQTTETGVIKIHSTRTRDPLRRIEEILFRSLKRRVSHHVIYFLEGVTPTCISIQTAY
ncbi:hypothetical protein CEXT_686941 [Caerostris extrusa]|uniref:Ribosomal protein S10 n=1 Tax=Caerostris extrusa TaxID=172846 RepID=A0AAV4M9L4_CAEEX|nr:hypothetical protein CEXT_686941 [Caerostris extrusa]